MPRSARDSDEEIDAKLGRKTRAYTEAVSVDSPLRRSARTRATTKQNQSSPDSPTSDTSNPSNTQTGRVTRRRTLAMEKDTGTEVHRKLRSRINSASSDLSEIIETDIATPKKKAGSSSDILTRIVNLRSKRLTRAGSEVSSSPAKRVTRTTRATSVEPDATTGYNLADRSIVELTATPVKTRRRTSVLPSEATVVEEKDEKLKIAVVTLDRKLPDFNVIKESEPQRRSTSKQTDESPSNSKDKASASDNSIGANGKDEDSCEAPSESIEEAPEREEPIKVSVLDSSLALNKQRVDNIDSNDVDSDAHEGTSKEDQKCTKVNDNDSDSNAARWFQDIPANEWKEKNTDTDKNSVHSMSTERLEHESEGECDFVLLDKESGLSAENMKADKDIETFDYDSDDTVLLKANKDLLKARKEEPLAMDVSEEECALYINKHNTSNSKNRKSMEQKESKEDSEREIEDTTENMEESTNIDKNESVVKDNRHSTSKCNLSLRKSLGRKSLSESHEAAAKEVNVSLNKSKLSDDESKQRKSLNRSMQESSKSVESNETGSAKKRPSLNKSSLKEIEDVETSSDSVIFTSAMKSQKNQSINSSTKKRRKAQRLNIHSTDESDDEFKNSEVQDERDSFTKKQLTRNYSVIASKGSVSDESKNTYDSDDSQNRSGKLPKFLFGGSTDSDSEGQDGSNQSIDSDIEKEYNLRGKSVSRYSDDDVPGDVCRASETESSDPNDNGSDLDDFVVGDHEVEDEDEDEEEEEEEEENKNEELDNEEDDEVDVLEIDEEVGTDDEMQIDEELEKEVSQGEDQIENDIERSTNQAVDTSSKERKKSRKSADLSQNLSKKITGSHKKKGKHDTDVSLSERCEKENSLSNISISIFQTPETRGKRASGDFIVDNVDRSLNDSKVKHNKHLKKAKGLMECSTPITNSKREKFKINIEMSNTSLDGSQKRLSTKALEAKEDDSSYKEETENKTLREEYSSKKLNKMKSNENFMHKSLPAELIELATKTNLSRSMSSNVVELNKTTFVPECQTPTTKFLKKDKLNESAPVLKLRTSLKKLKEMKDRNEPHNQLEDENDSSNKQDAESMKGIDDSLKEKLLKLADNLLENDQPKKRKKRRQSVAEVGSTVLLEDYIQKNQNLGATEQNRNIVPVSNADDNVPANDTVPADKKKKKKKKGRHNTDVSTEEEPREISIETKSVSKDKEVHNKGKKKKKSNNIDASTEEDSLEIGIETKSVNKDKKVHNEGKKKKKKTNNKNASTEEELREISIETKSVNKAKKVHNEGKKKNKKENAIETVSDLENNSGERKIVEKKKKVLDTSPGENVSNDKLLKKKQKKQKLLSEDVVPQDEEVAPCEKLPKKKKKLRSEGNALQQEGISDKKILKTKRKLSEYTSQDEHVVVEKLPKKKKALLESEESNVKSTTSIKSKGFTNKASNSSEGLIVRQSEALKVQKRATDSTQTHNKMKNLKEKERTESNTQNEGKVKKLESKNQTTKTNKMDPRRTSIKRCSDDLLESLSDVQMKPLKRRKISKLEDQLSSYSIQNKNAKIIKGSTFGEEDSTALPSTSGSTTTFIITDLSKIKTRKKRPEVSSFKQRMINRKLRQPVSAYMMYLEKQKASGKDKFSRPY